MNCVDLRCNPRIRSPPVSQDPASANRFSKTAYTRSGLDLSRSQHLHKMSAWTQMSCALLGFYSVYDGKAACTGTYIQVRVMPLELKMKCFCSLAETEKAMESEALLSSSSNCMTPWQTYPSATPTCRFQFPLSPVRLGYLIYCHVSHLSLYQPLPLTSALLYAILMHQHRSLRSCLPRNWLVRE